LQFLSVEEHETLLDRVSWSHPTPVVLGHHGPTSGENSSPGALLGPTYPRSSHSNPGRTRVGAEREFGPTAGNGTGWRFDRPHCQRFIIDVDALRDR
jgi:hypothetical protein